MATETLYASSLTSGTVSTSGNALGAPNGAYTSDTGSTSWTARFAIGDPTGNTANGSHAVTARVRKVSGQSGTPVLNSISLYDGSTLIATRTLDTNVTSTVSQDVVATFTESEVRSVASLANLEVEIVTTAAGGSPGARTPVQLDAFTWSGDFTTVTSAIDLIVQGVVQAHVVDSPTLTQVHILSVDNAVHAHTAGSPTLSLPVAPVDLVVAEAIHAQSSTIPTLYVVPTLAVQHAVHSQVAESPTLSVAAASINLVVQNAAHAQVVDSPTLVSVGPIALVVQDSVHAHIAGSPALTVLGAPKIWPPSQNQILPPAAYPSKVNFRRDGADYEEATNWSQHYQLLWDGFLPEVDSG